MTGNPLAGTARIGWMEFWSHLKSPRLVILVVLLALLVFGASYGLSQSSPFGGLSPMLNLAVHPAIRNESGIDHFLVIGWLADQRGVPRAGATVSVYRQDSSGPYDTPYGTLTENLTTNATGFVVYDAGAPPPENVSYGLLYAPYGFGTAGFYPALSNRTFTTGNIMTSTYSGPSGSESYFSLHVMTLDGYPATRANVSVDGNFSGHPDSNGFYSLSIGEGEHLVEVSYLGFNETYFAGGAAHTGPVYENGADAVLMTLAGSFMQLILPVMAIAISFDAIARERAQGSLEILLARRVRREGILVGKFLGAFASVAIPTVAVLLGGIAVVTVVSGRAPTASFAAVVIGASLLLLAVYVILMLLFSTLAKSVGTAVVFGVVVWLFFNIMFSFVAVFLLFAAAMNPTTPEFYGTLVSVLLFDPNLVYQMLVSVAVPMTGGGANFGLVPTGYLSTATLILAAVLWIIIPLLLTTLIFRRKAES
jgi:ABC-type transport system involved in multi-copper enzyme maturation permease subunit